MSSKQQMKRRSVGVLSAFCVVLFCAGVVTSFTNTDAGKPVRRYIVTSSGNVLFDHQMHADQAMACETCHHEIVMTSEMASCQDCHEDGYSAEDFSHEDLVMIEAHECAGCHAIGDAKQIQNCRVCHPAAQDGTERVLACSECHEDGYEPEMLMHDDMQMIHESLGCEACHQTASVSTAYHDQCTACHLETGKPVFQTASGEVNCQACHLK